VRARGSSLSKLAIQFSIQNPDIATTLIGTAIPAELERNLRWADEPIDEELLRVVQHKLAPVKDITWTTGRTENN
jgi:aryl-alcohol dehydrogenase-like predicted oxidoreductase